MKDLLFYKRIDLIAINVFWIGYLLYVSCFVLQTTQALSFVLLQLFQLAAIAMIFASSFKLVRFDLDNEYLKVLFVLFAFWAFTIFFRGVMEGITKENRGTLLFNPWFGSFIYFSPWILLFPKKLIFYKKIFVAINLSGALFLVFSLFFLDMLLVEGKDVLSQAIIEYFSKTLAITALFTLFTYKYHSNRVIWFAIFVIFVTLLLGVYRARRGLLFLIVLGLLFNFVIVFLNSKSKSKFIFNSVSVLLVMLIIGIGIVKYSDIDIFGHLEERGMEDTRYMVELYFLRDMKDWDWVVGRGMFGKYYSPTQFFYDGAYRGTIETDYLNMILKGGLVNLVLLLLIVLPAIVKGIFFSKNNLALASGFWTLFWLLNTYPSTIQVFSLSYLLVWTGAGICYSKFLRNLPDELLVRYFRRPIKFSRITKN